MFLFPDVPTGSEHTEDPLRQAAQAAAQATCNHCHQRLQYAESLPTSLTGDTRKLRYHLSSLSLYHTELLRLQGNNIKDSYNLLMTLVGNLYIVLLQHNIESRA